MSKSGSSKIGSKGKKLLIILMSAVIAVALGITCALCFGNANRIGVDNVQSGGEVTASATITNPASGTNYTNVTAGSRTLFSGDVINYTTTGIRTVVLPAGTYQLEAWGGQGGGSGGNWTMGYGGYTKATYTITGNTTLWIVVGGKGANGVTNQRTSDAAGGYNGGGAGGRDVYDMNQPAGGGGGATHFATAARGNNLLSAYNSYRTDLLIVAGGGGGASSANPNNAAYNGGGGGNNAGYNGWSTTLGNNGGVVPNGSGGGGGSTAGGRGGLCTTVKFSNGYQGNSHGAYAGTFGQGGNGGVNHAGGGGGGGGFFGGGGGGVYNWNGGTGAADSAGYCNNAGGGSGYANTSKVTLTGATNGARAGDGYARITVLNQNPVSKNAPVNAGSRGTGKTLDILASTLARDPDFHLRAQNSTENDMFYTAGSASNLETLPTNTAALYLNAACTTSASNFINWEVRSNNTIRITAVKRYPRASADGNTSTANGKLILYTKVRDAYGSATAHGWAVVSFTLNVDDSALALRTTSNPNGTLNTDYTTPTVGGKTYIEYKKTGGSGSNTYNYTYRLGDSTSNSQSIDYVTAGGIYNSAAAGTKTVFIPNPLTPNITSGYTVNVADLFTDADTAYDVVGIKSVSGSSSYYTTKINTNTSIYGTSGLGASITISPTSTQPATPQFIVVDLTVQSYEKASGQGGTGAGVLMGSTSVVKLAFKISNTRPVMKDELLVTLSLDETAGVAPRYYDVKINDFLRDPDGNTPVFLMGAANIKVPTYEYMSVNKLGTVLSLKSGSNYNKGVVGGDTVTTGESAPGNAPANYSTGFNTRVLAAAGSSAASDACVTYQYMDSSTLRLTARAATQFMYRNEAQRIGHFYIMVKVSDPGEPTDNGIWFPIAIKVESTAPTMPQTAASFRVSHVVNAENGQWDAKPIYLSPISYTDASGTLHAIGSISKGNFTIPEGSNDVYPFVTDADVFQYSQDPEHANPLTAELNDVIALNGTTVASALDAAQIERLAPFFKVELVDMYASQSVFANLTPTQLENLNVTEYDGLNNSTGYTFKGLQITPVRGTDGYYFEFDVNVRDAYGKTTDKIPVFVLVENRAVSLRDDPDDSDSSYPFNTVGEKGSYFNNSDTGEFYMNYVITKSESDDPDLRITPYDLVYDYDSATVDGTANGILNNTNPDDADFAKTAKAITKPYRVKRTLTPNDLDSVAEADVTCNKLSFSGIAGFNSLALLYSPYFDAKIDGEENTKVTVDGVEYAIPSITFRAKSRTSASVPVLRFTVTDGFTTVNCSVAITVRNGAPILNDVIHPSKGGLSSFYTLTAGMGDSSVPGSIEFPVTGTRRDDGGISGNGYALCYDLDGDTPTLLPDRIAIVAYDSVAKEYVSVITVDGVTYDLSEYISATQTIGTGTNMGEEIILVKGLSSTQLIPVPIYLQFEVSDGYRAQPATATLRVRLQVVNSKTEVKTDSFVATGEDAASQTYDYTWQVKYDYAVEKATARYLVNSPELYNSSAIAASSSNKVLLFDDADAKQTTLLNPSYIATSTGTNKNLLLPKGGSGADSGSYTVPLVKQYDGQVTEATPRPITAAAFENETAAVIYTRTYSTSNSSVEDSSDAYLNIEVLFFDDDFMPIGHMSGADINKSKYWAIKITDSLKFSSAGDYSAQIAIAVRDDHYHNTRYSANGANSIESSDDILDDSHVKVYNIFFQYLEPGITVMHDYYRTDGNAESASLLKQDGSVADYVVDIDYLNSRVYATGSTVPTTQTGLRSATFTDKFQYEYFQNVHFGENDSVSIVPKRFAPQTPFYYQPIVVSSTVQSVPMSYLAMPQGYDDNGTDSAVSTTAGSHVIFANATTNETTFNQGYADLLDTSVISGNSANRHYTTWSQELVFKNLTLSDGVTTWSGALPSTDPNYITKNPYVTITYIKNTNYISSDLYLNTQRGKLSDDGQFTSYEDSKWRPGGVSIFREDKFGFSFVKKANGQRTTNNLRLTVDVQTSGKSNVTTAFVDLIIANTDPSITYGTTGNTQNASDTTIEVDMQMTMRNATSYVESNKTVNAGKSIEIKSSNASATSDYALSYSNNGYDSTDTVRFFMPSATDGLMKNAMTAAEFKFLTTNAGMRGNSYAEYYSLKVGSDSNYYDKDETNMIAANAITIPDRAENYIPNPGYKNFFTVSPESGTASMLRFTPVAKTQLNIPDGATEADVLKANHLEKDAKGIYYPFRVLVFDEVNGSSITDGSFTLVLIKVYISNEVLRPVDATRYKATGASTAVVDEYKYKFNLTKGVGYALDVSALFADNDIVMNGASYAVVSDEAWTTLKPTQASGESDDDYAKRVADVTENKQLVSDYLIMPAANSYTLKEGDATNNPITVTVSESSKTTLIFKTDSAFRVSGDNGIALMYEFADLGGSKLKIVFCIEYNNEAPTVNSDTYGNSEVIDITLKTNETFTVHATAADNTTFTNDRLGGYNSPDLFSAAKQKADFNYPTQTAKALFEDFKYFTSSLGNTERHGTEIVVGNDDAPSTLRFVYAGNNKNAVAQFTGNGADMITCVSSNFVPSEYAPNDTTNARPMSITFTAKGVTNTVATLTLSDGRMTTSIRLHITVESTAPEAIYDLSKLPSSDTLGAPLTLPNDNTPDTYEVHLTYGGSPFVIDLDDLVYDPDKGDDLSLTIPAIFGGQRFKTANSEGVNISAVMPEFLEDTVRHTTKLRLSAIDYIPVEDGYTTVTLCVADAHGATSKEINFRVFVKPADMSVKATAAKAASITLKSVAASLVSEDIDTLTLVTSANTASTIVLDPDAAAPTALYNVQVYAVLDESKSNTLDAAKININDVSSANLIIERVQATSSSSAQTRYGTGDVAEYVQKYFDVGISADGKTLTFVPNAATIKSGKIAPISLYVRIVKPYTVANDADKKVANAFVNVSVANSAPVATVDHPDINRDNENYLSFTGIAGETYSWDLYNLENSDYGLFHDYDKKNVPEEKVEYVSGRVLASYRDSETGQVINTPADVTAAGYPVLDIIEDENGGVKIKINRKVNPKLEVGAVSTTIPVEIRCRDSLKAEATTVIYVNVENDVPEFKTVSGNNYGYTVNYSEYDGYSMYLSIPTNRSVTVRVADILDDADIAMDVYSFDTMGLENGLSNPSSENPNEERNVPGTTMFTYRVTSGPNEYRTPTMTGIVFKCVSTDRLKEAICQMRLRDSTGTARTSRLTIHLVVGNTAPVAIPEKLEISIMGVSKDASDTEVERASFTDIITNYVRDINPGDMVDANNEEYRNSTTYIYLASKTLYTVYDEMGTVVYGNGLRDETDDDYMGENETACNITWSKRETDESDMHQVFTVSPKPGVFGVQKVRFTVKDDGYQNGALAFVDDGLSVDLDITINILRPISDFEDQLKTIDIAQGVTRVITAEMLLETEGDDPNSNGYNVIKNIVSKSDALQVTAPENKVSKSAVSTSAVSVTSKKYNWRVKAARREVNPVMTVTFDVGGKDVTHDFIVNITENHKPELRKDVEIGTYNTLEDNIVIISPTDWFTDEDADDEIRFIAPIKVKTSSYAEAHIERNRTFTDAETGETYMQDVLVIKFKNRGATEITVNVSDSSGRVYSYTVPIECTDAPPISFWSSVTAAFQEKPFIWWPILVGILLFILLLIIIIVVVCKKRKMRREIEMLLESESELEADLLRLGSAAPYQSFGYLPPTTPTMNDPGLMLGSNNVPPPSSLQLNVGQTTNITPPPQPNPVQTPPPPQAGETVTSSTTTTTTTVTSSISVQTDDFDPNDF